MCMMDSWTTEDGLLKIQGWSRDGLSMAQIAKNMGVASRTLDYWKAKNDAIREALRKGKEVVDREVENAMLKSAMGYTQKIKRPVKIREVEYDPKTGKKLREFEKWVQVEEEQYIAPNVTAQIFWLKNRKPAEWRDRGDISLSPSNGVLESLMELHRSDDDGGGENPVE